MNMIRGEKVLPVITPVPCILWITMNWAEKKIYIQSKSSGRTIARVYAEHFEEGRYISFRADESIVISIRRTAGPNVVLSGFFLGLIA